MKLIYRRQASVIEVEVPWEENAGFVPPPVISFGIITTALRPEDRKMMLADFVYDGRAQ